MSELDMTPLMVEVARQMSKLSSSFIGDPLPKDRVLAIALDGAALLSDILGLEVAVLPDKCMGDTIVYRLTFPELDYPGN